MSRTNYHQSSNSIESFICRRCGRVVSAAADGTSHRNHCSFCLWSLHVDMRTGDRRSACRGLMEPVGVWVLPDTEWSLIHRCTSCGFLRSNRIAGDDNEAALLSLALRPLMQLPFPADSLVSEIATMNFIGERK